MAENDTLSNGAAADNGDSSEFFDTDFPPLKPTTPTTPSSPDSDEITRLTTRISQLELEKAAEVEKAETAENAAEVIAKRAFELEGEVARAQHDLITAMNSVDEAGSEIDKLTDTVTALRAEKAEMEDKLKKLKELLVESEGKVKAVEEKMDALASQSAESSAVVSGLMDRIAEREAGFDDDKGVGDGVGVGLKERLPLIGAFSAGVIAAGVAVCCVKYIRKN